MAGVRRCHDAGCQVQVPVGTVPVAPETPCCLCLTLHTLAISAPDKANSLIHAAHHKAKRSALEDGSRPWEPRSSSLHCSTRVAPWSRGQSSRRTSETEVMAGGVFPGSSAPRGGARCLELWGRGFCSGDGGHGSGLGGLSQAVEWLA